MTRQDERTDPEAKTVLGGEHFGLAEDFASVARELSSQEDAEAVLARICHLAVQRVAGCRHAAVLLLERRGRMSTHGSTDEVPELVDSVQCDTGEGPCLEVIQGADLAVSPDLTVELRWPTFAQKAVELTGIRSIVSFRLFDGTRTLGGLNFYSPAPNAFAMNAGITRWGKVYAAHASLALSGARKQQDLKAALESRESISIAMGLIMARENISRQQAFDVLRRASQRMNVRLRDVADSIAGGGDQVTPSDLHRMLDLLGTEEEALRWR
jgi:hypothetical protein